VTVNSDQYFDTGQPDHPIQSLELGHVNSFETRSIVFACGKEAVNRALTIQVIVPKFRNHPDPSGFSSCFPKK
jgi:hypothetical protein